MSLDYRGFGDSEGIPSEQGLGDDARAAWEWLKEHGAKDGDILVTGQSLGTGVVAKLVGALGKEGTPAPLGTVATREVTRSSGISPRGAVLFAPYTSIPLLLKEYNLFGVLPVFKPVEFIPWFSGACSKPSCV